MQRSADVRRTFSALTWSAGANWHNDDWILRLNVGKAFRVPIAKELGADGVNYHIFRYEQGNAGLDPERSYQVDSCFYTFFYLFVIVFDSETTKKLAP